VEKANSVLQGERDAIKLERLVQDKAYQLAADESAAQVKDAKTTQDMELKAKNEANELAMLEKRLAVEKTLSPVNLQKMQLDTVKHVYSKLPLKEVKLVNLSGTQGGLGGLLPGLAEAAKQVTGPVSDVWDRMSSTSEH